MHTSTPWQNATLTVSAVFELKYNRLNRFVHSCLQLASGARDKSLLEHDFFTAAHDNTIDPFFLLHVGKKKPNSCSMNPTLRWKCHLEEVTTN